MRLNLYRTFNTCTFENNSGLNKAIQDVKEKNKALHLIGLISVLKIERVVGARDRGAITRLIKTLSFSYIYRYGQQKYYDSSGCAVQFSRLSFGIQVAEKVQQEIEGMIKQCAVCV